MLTCNIIQERESIIDKEDYGLESCSDLLYEMFLVHHLDKMDCDDVSCELSKFTAIPCVTSESIDCSGIQANTQGTSLTCDITLTQL